jgi:hypothetical protein
MNGWMFEEARMNNNNIIMRLETQQHDFQLSTGRPGKIIN